MADIISEETREKAETAATAEKLDALIKQLKEVAGLVCLVVEYERARFAVISQPMRDLEAKMRELLEK